MSRIAAITFLAVIASVSPALSIAQQEADRLLGVFTAAPASSKVMGTQLTIIGLSTAEPIMVWPDGYDKKMKKIFENPNLIVLQSVGAVGSTDTMYIETKNKKFLVVSVGAMATAMIGKSVTLSQYRGDIR